MMWPKGIAFAITIFSNIITNNAIKCRDFETTKYAKDVLRNTTCEGNLCMNFEYKPFQQMDKTCITTGALKITTGCVQYDITNKDLIVCFCDTDFCNSGDPVGSPKVLQEYNCSSTFTSPRLTYSLAPACSITAVKQGSNLTVTRLAENDFELAISVPVTRIASLEYFSFYIGIVHTISGLSDNAIHHHYKCYGNHCNMRDAKKFKSKTDVTCQSADGGKCQGEFCVFATNGTSVTNYCLSTVSVTTKEKYEIGVFRYKDATFYLCNEDHCNSDEETAKKSIAAKKRQSAVDDTLTTTTVESPQAVVVDNSGDTLRYTGLVILTSLVNLIKH